MGKQAAISNRIAATDTENFYWQRWDVEECGCGEIYPPRDNLENYCCPECGKRSQFTILSASVLEFDQVRQTRGIDAARQLCLGHKERTPEQVARFLALAGQMFMKGII